MYQEYISKWKQYSTQYGPQTCLFYLVGKFYELYDILDKTTGDGQTNVRQAVETLGITLTVREKDGPQGEDCLFAGFPEQSLQKFAGVLTRDGWTVVVCDQDKNSSGKVTGRPIARIFSPGTHVELAGADAPYLAGLWLQESLESPPSYAAAVLDLTTGALCSVEGITQGSSEIWSADELVHFFQLYPPRETVVWWRGAPLTVPQEAILRRRCGIPKGSLHVESGSAETQGTLEVPLVRKAYLEGLFSKTLSLLPILEQLQIRSKPLTERCLVSLLRFAEDHLPSAIQNLSNHTVWCPHTSVYMGNNSLAQLNYVSTGSEQSVLSLFSKAITSLGKRALRTRLLTPSADVSVIQTGLQDVTTFYTLSDAELKPMESWLRGIQDLARLHRKILLTTVTPTDILALDTSYGSAQRLESLLRGTCLEWTAEERTQIETYRSLFASCFDLEKAKLAIRNEDLTCLPDAKAPKTAELETRLADRKTQTQELVEQLRIWIGLPPDAIRLEATDTSYLQLTATKTVLKLVREKLQRTPSAEHSSPGLSVHEKKSSRGTIECPALDTITAQIFALRSRLSQAVKEELPPLCSAVHHEAWKLLETWIARVDGSLTLAKVAKERGYTKPEIVEGDEGGLLALGLRHPLLESVQTRTEYVKHDVSLGMDEEAGWLLYGMNASGKSSLMKAIGVSVLLAQAGSYVPATVFKLKPFRRVLTRILNTDNLWAGLSSFAVEVSELRDIFQKADQTSLVLGDELCSGTESVSATSLVAAGIKHLHSKHSRFVFATHLHDLNKLPEISRLPGLGIWHLRVHYIAATDTLIYDRTLHRGPGGTLYGLEVARAMHLPHEILNQALAYRRQLLGEASLEEAPLSQWNPQILRKTCELCSSQIVRDLEVHHIVPRMEAKEGRLSDGTSMNDARNLIVVCQVCHDKHHAGLLTIGPLVQTSSGPQRQTTEVAPSQTPARKLKVKWTPEEQETIERLLRKFPHLPLQRLVLDLRDQYDITISAAALGKLRGTLS